MRKFYITTLCLSLFTIGLTYGLTTNAAQAQDNSDQNSDTPPPWSMADQYYDPEEMQQAREAVQNGSGNSLEWIVMGDRLEWQNREGNQSFLWDAQGWVGYDINKLFIKTEGDYNFDENTLEDAEIQALWSHAISPYWDIQTGLRYDFEPQGTAHAVLGLQGLAPYFFEVDIAGFISDDGDVTARAEAEYDLLLTQRLILQPRIEADFSAQDIPELDLGAGLTNLDAGLRLRYEIKREFAPYIGVEYQSTFGETASIIKNNGGDSNGVAFVLGLHTWF